MNRAGDRSHSCPRAPRPRGAGWTIALLTLTGGSLHAAGAPEQAPPAPGQPAPAEQPLKGPDVKDHSAPGVPSTFGAPMAGAPGQQMERPIAHPVFMKIVGMLRGEDVEPSLRLTPEQESLIQTLEAEHRKQIEAYRYEHRAEFADLQARLRQHERESAAGAPERNESSPGSTPAGKPHRGAPPPRRPKETGEEGPPSPPTPESMRAAEAERVRLRLRELRAGTPDGADVRLKIWEMMNPGQQAFAQGKLDAIRAELIRNRAQQDVQNRLKNADGKDKKPGPDARPVAPADAPPDATKPGARRENRSPASQNDVVAPKSRRGDG